MEEGEPGQAGWAVFPSTLGFKGDNTAFVSTWGPWGLDLAGSGFRVRLWVTENVRSESESRLTLEFVWMKKLTPNFSQRWGLLGLDEELQLGFGLELITGKNNNFALLSG